MSQQQKHRKIPRKILKKLKCDQFYVKCILNFLKSNKCFTLASRFNSFFLLLNIINLVDRKKNFNYDLITEKI